MYRNLNALKEATSDDIFDILLTGPNKQCSIDPAPTWPTKEMEDVDLLAPVIANVITSRSNKIDSRRLKTKPSSDGD